MTSAVRSVMTAGVAVVGAGAVAIAPSVQPPAAPAPRIQLAAATSPFVTPVAPVDLRAAFPQPPSPAVPALDSAGNVIINVYNAVEPWVQWGFELATYAVGWVPYVGYLAGQIMIGYDFGEAIVQSIVYNFAYWIDGSVSFTQGLANIATDSLDAVGQLIVNEVNWLLGWLPPLPPWPPLLTAAESADNTETPVTARPLQQLRDRLLDPVDAVTSAVDAVGGAAADPAESDVADADAATALTSDVADLPRGDLVKAALAAPRTVADGLVQARGEIRGGVAEAVEDVSQAARSGQRGAVRQAVADAPATVADGVKTAVGGLKNAGHDVRKAVKAPKADGAD